MNEDCSSEAQLALLRLTYLSLINDTLPARFTHPVQHNHCFARIILDWIFSDCWYQHLSNNKPAYQQLSIPQLEAAIRRMEQWLQEPQVLMNDHLASLQYRKKNYLK